jgi:glycerol-3-phosphate acyltransferase PlsX
MKIVIDVMGGDQPPGEIIKGVERAYEKLDNIELILVGKNDIMSREIAKYNLPSDKCQFITATQTVEMNESPAKALRKKKDSSINVGTNLVKENKAKAFISAGNTGAVMAAGLFNIGRLSGIKRPSIATLFPSATGRTLVMDAGANMDCSPENLLQFAIMGQIQAQNVLNIKSPRIGLLNVGEEEKKGNKLTKNTYELINEDKRVNNFIGNVEGRDIFNGNCDVIICDGFVGNVVLKTTEGAASFMFDLLKENLKTDMRSKLGALLLKPYLKNLQTRLDYRQYGGAPLLGINGVVIISHGSSDATAIYNAIKVAKETVDENVVNLIKNEINKDGENKNA